MAKRPTIEDHLLRLNDLRPVAHTPEAKAELRAALKDKSNLIVARAASVVREAALHDFVPDLEQSLARLLDGTPADKGCAAMTAVAEALHALEARSADVFLRGIKHVQKEGSFGPPTDVATRLRGICAMALVQMGYRHALHYLADLLSDPEPNARIDAANALGSSGRDEAGAILRLKALSKDEPEVIAECVVALTRLRSHGWLEFVEAFLDHDDEHVRNSAAIALGETHRPEAFELLRKRWESTLDQAARKELLLPMAMCRLPAAVDFLFDVIARSPMKLALGAIEGLRLYRTDAAVKQRLEGALVARDEPELRDLFNRYFR